MTQRILVVDDDPYLRDIYQETLTGAGYDVEIADDGVTGAAKLHKGGYALCLLDIMLPKVDGLGVLESISNNPPQVPNGPIIVLTNLSHEPLIEDAMKKGATSYLVKADLTPNVLVQEVKKALSAISA